MNGFNLSDITDAKLGTTTLGSIYLGSTKLWPLGTDYSKEYLTFESLADNNTITWTFTGSDPIQNVIYWSKNGTSWTSAIALTSDTPVSLATLNKGEKMYLKGENVTYASSTTNYSHFNSDYEFNVSGNIMSLIYGDNFIGQTTLSSDYNFVHIFKSSKVVNASNLILPATTLASSCYYGMFRGCTSLVAAPELPATTLTSSCYSNMFRGCTSLATAPELPATTLTGTYCYSYMFQGCTSLATAPELPATKLTADCYGYMFSNCTSLATAPELPATTLANYCYEHMFEGCTSLTAAPVLSATTLANYCYSNMFNGCTSLATATELPATTLKLNCYSSMFYKCTSLATAPVLPATTLAKSCYYYMFCGCTSLSYIKCLATDISASNSHTKWVAYVAANGTFVKPASMTSWPSDANGIPSGWTVVNV